ncbi:MAG: four helix bundle protein [Deltaproteobacteria bacterium CG12_big_fil_rev_8_21_14_0_65_43_10]|nr:MAG: four helix bundle protein [Deltaproteobacteria bacterium CG12_big_fil_rev_8_21_14_0_65_43_10]PIX25787.1 MAG: four helix bundle protein [Deltaproteobacteria bacterium CG_4_8_14_3_um_filter_43_13]PIZ20064.1 MAG: four helix bundle protein [Deltaproteobacteria bacterium CG_4_10_14_0_8_um_filter_43_12]PJB45605.1 MAG: four helix bundle protein [Deltaproteobacteria bacterium CG_4_9_14_3_um_filter_44_9]HCX89474.1 four helix bundle protein [Deltaproteobacteria bacterium]
MNSQELKDRTKRFALKVIQSVETLPKHQAGNVIGRQLLRSATSVGANYRAACRARSRADFISKMGIVEEEADETIYWLELLVESGLINKEAIEDLIKEANELTAIFTAACKSAKAKKPRLIRNPQSEIINLSLCPKGRFPLTNIRLAGIY